MQARTVGSIIATALLLAGLAGCRNMPRGGLAGREPDVRTIAGIGVRPERIAAREKAPSSSTISSRVDPPGVEERQDRIVGQVVDDRGVPVANARVRLAVDGAPGGREVEGTTNRSGQFLLKGLRPGERYTLVAEWGAGRDLLLGRSSVAAPAEEVRIQVASAGKPDQASTTSGVRFESARVFEFEPSPIDRDDAFEPSSNSGDPPQHPEDSAPADSGRRAGWIPTDSVRRASLGPEDLAPLADASEPRDVRPRARDGSPPTDPMPLGPTPDFLPTPESEEEPGSIPDDWAVLPDSRSGPSASRPRTDSQASRPPAPIARRPVDPRSEEPSRRRGEAIAMPDVQHFEPESAGDLDDPDPPLLRADEPSEAEPRDEAPEESPLPDGRTAPGAMQLAPPPLAGPPVAEEVVEAPEETTGPDDTPDPNAPELAPLPEQAGDPDDPLDIAPEGGPEGSLPVGAIDPPTDQEPQDGPADAGPLDAPGPPEVFERVVDQMPAEATPAEPGQPIRWADLPEPRRIAPEEEEGGEAASAEPDGPGRWAAGLRKLVGLDRDQIEPEAASAITPAVRFDADRNRLDDFILPDLGGRPFRLSGAESDFVLLCFWGTWCDPCLAAMPHLTELQEQFGEGRLRVVSIAYQRGGEGGPRSVSRASRRLGLNFPVLLAPADGSCPVARAMDVQYFPTLVLLDREGRVVHRETGATGESLMRLDRAVASAMDEGVMRVTRR